MNSTALSASGDYIEYAAGSVTIRLTKNNDGSFATNVFSGPSRVDALCNTRTDEHLARSQARLLASALKDGMSVWQFAADALHAQQGVVASAEQVLDGALQTAAAGPVGTVSDAEIAHLQADKPNDTSYTAARINADWDARDRQARQDADKQAADVADIMANSQGFRPYGRRRQVPPTMAGAHLSAVTEPQQRAIEAAKDGVVFVSRDVTAQTLRAMARKGLGELTYEGSRRRIVGMVLNQRGLRAAS